MVTGIKIKITKQTESTSIKNIGNTNKAHNQQHIQQRNRKNTCF
jgi:hypothetical protein